jgi:lactate dehydrogenase-like 2-hydroxyacid dehydrogenase
VPAVLVTEQEYRKGEAVFLSAAPFECRPAPADEDALAAAVRASGVRYVIVGGRPYRGPLYEALPSGGVIARFGVGYDGIDRGRAARLGLLCTNTPGVLAQSVAEHAVLLMLAAARRFQTFPVPIHTGQWTPPPPVGVELAGRTLAVVGCGEIGRATARIAKRGFGMRVVGVSRSAAAQPAQAAGDFDLVTPDFRAAALQAHFISLHIPARPENAGFVNRARLACVRADAWLVNTARGAVVDEDALFEALAAGRIGGAALDVFAREPYRPVDPARDLRALPNVVLTPHVGSHTLEANRAMAERALRNIRLADAGRVDDMDRLPT